MTHARTKALGVAVLLGLALAQAAEARMCTGSELSDAVDAAGAALRKVHADGMPAFQARVRQLAAKQGWSEAEAQEKAFALAQDARIEKFDADANDLLARIDTIGSGVGSGDIDCARIDELSAASLELQATMRAKSAYLLDRLASLAGVAPEPRKQASAPDKRAEPGVRAPPPVAPRKTWSTATSTEAPAPPPLLTPIPVEEGYTIDEVKAVSEGFFGKLSSGLAGAIEYTFRNSGRPAGYVLGSEGGGAILAGLRYGKGTLYLRGGGQRPIFWHGPSIGTDLGGEGSKILFLIYKLEKPEELYSNFTVIDGTAYVVGGVGVTLVTNGRIVMAPIRSGLGLRLGASVGYIRFTARPTWNPF